MSTSLYPVLPAPWEWRESGDQFVAVRQMDNYLYAHIVPERVSGHWVVLRVHVDGPASTTLVGAYSDIDDAIMRADEIVL
ncbi:hypothetical protein BI081_gp133 [Mycobacterium phage Tonenili]|uniref:Uncharacterized protein n=1 Tax=Mycobacterium phage Tonenili TaxID=1891703 RepID=A0A1C9EHK6_9CAUD|nr:hypothetical protein BI081_gp133 [Mycobacterium phage Tonenili]AON96974.1 hypothetical protein SEA_TONENILI_256 [Mycobacterium phage Tonenili]